MQTDAEERAANWRQVRRYTATFWVIIIFVFVAGLLTGAGAAAGWGIDNILLVWVFMMAFCCTSNAATDSPPASHDVEEKAPPTQRPAKRKRMHWLDNLKSCLICGVVLGHTCMAMWGTGAGIRFMHIDWNDRRYSAFNLLVYVGLCVFKPLVVPLFFFVSGYFAPSSLRRKGRASFLRSNATRMGGVFLVFWLVFNPCMQFFGASLVRPTMYSPSYFPTSPHTWFLLWLLVFQTMYACLPFPSACTMPLPTFGPICRVGLTVALVQLLACILMLVCGSSLGLAEMPMNGAPSAPRPAHSSNSRPRLAGESQDRVATGSSTPWASPLASWRGEAAGSVNGRRAISLHTAASTSAWQSSCSWGSGA